MGTTSGVSVTHYLHEIYRPDCDYVDGEVQERNMGEREHAAWQGTLTEYFRRTPISVDLAEIADDLE